MNPIGNYLERFFNSHREQSNIKTVVAIIVKNISDINIPEAFIELRGTKIYFKVHSTILSELYMHKTSLIAELKKKTSTHYTIAGL